MKKEFIPYEQAVDLEKLGFDEPCFIDYYIEKNEMYIEHHENGITNTELNIDTDRLNKEQSEDGEFLFEYSYAGPLYQQAFRWFREKYGYYYPIHRTTNNTNQVLYSIGPYAGDYFTYEEAELACLKKLIEIVKNEKNSNIEL